MGAPGAPHKKQALHHSSWLSDPDHGQSLKDEMEGVAREMVPGQNHHYGVTLTGKGYVPARTDLAHLLARGWCLLNTTSESVLACPGCRPPVSSRLSQP